jgi:hypothetical protein
MLSVIMLNVVMPNVVMPNVVVPDIYPYIFIMGNIFFSIFTESNFKASKLTFSLAWSILGPIHQMLLLTA